MGTWHACAFRQRPYAPLQDRGKSFKKFGLSYPPESRHSSFLKPKIEKCPIDFFCTNKSKKLPATVHYNKLKIRWANSRYVLFRAKLLGLVIVSPRSNIKKCMSYLWNFQIAGSLYRLPLCSTQNFSLSLLLSILQTLCHWKFINALISVQDSLPNSVSLWSLPTLNKGLRCQWASDLVHSCELLRFMSINKKVIPKRLNHCAMNSMISYTNTSLPQQQLLYHEFSQT